MMPNNAKHYDVSVEYYCPNCDISFPISELVEVTKRKKVLITFYIILCTVSLLSGCTHNETVPLCV